MLHKQARAPTAAAARVWQATPVWHTAGVSIVAMVGIAAVCAAVIGYERWQVRFEAKRRRADRRARRTVSWSTAPWHRPWWSGPGIESESDPWLDEATTRLCSELERAVLVGDEAFVYRRRFEARRDVSESPFQIRRGKMASAVARYSHALQRVHRLAHAWLQEKSLGADDHRRRHAVTTMVDTLVARGGEAMSFEGIAATLDLMENTLANLMLSQRARATAHPFR